MKSKKKQENIIWIFKYTVIHLEVDPNLNNTRTIQVCAKF